MKKYITLMVITCLLAVTISPAYANSIIRFNNTDRENIEMFVDKDEDYSGMVEKAFKIKGIETVSVYFNEDSKNVSDNKYFTKGPLYQLNIKNVREAKDYIGETVDIMVTGEPDISICLLKNEKTKTTINNTYGISSSKISNAVGWSITDINIMPLRGSYMVPKMHNGEKIKDATLKAKIIYKVKEFDVYYEISGTTISNKLGKVNIKKPYGLYFYNTYNYR